MLSQPKNNFPTSLCVISVMVNMLEREISSHKILVHYGKKYECVHCTLIFTHMGSLVEHERSFHF